MEFLYPIIYFPYLKRKKTICLCKTRADAEEMVLSLTENQPYDEYLDDKCIHNVEGYFYDPFIHCDYFIGNPMEVVP